MTEPLSKNNRISAVKWGLFVVFVVLFALDAWFVVSGSSAGFDEKALAVFFSFREPAFTTIMKGITLCGDTKVVAVLCIIIIILPGRMKVGLPVAVMAGAGSLVNTAIKVIVARPRPSELNWLIEEDGFSFPSGHANASLIFYTALAIVVGRILIRQDQRFLALIMRILFVIFAVLIGLSRPYLGVHYFTDIFGGWMLASLLLILFFQFYDNVWPEKWRVPDSRTLDSRIPDSAT